MSRIPAMLECFRQLIATPSVSCIDPHLDQSNRGMAELLAGWLTDIGFSVELMPVADQCVGGHERHDQCPDGMAQ